MLALLPLFLAAQGRKDLEKKRDALDKQIKATSSLISQAQKEQRSTQQQLQLLEAQIRQRQELINTMNSEVFRVDQEIQETQDVVRSLEGDLTKLKEEYARMVQYAYMNRSAYDRLSYIFAAESFAQAFKRSRYLDQLAEQRRQQAVLITETQASLGRKVTDLQVKRDDKAKLLGLQVDEKKKLTTDKSGQQTTLAGLKKEEGRLKETLRKQEKQRTELAAAIRKSIESEIRKGDKGVATKPGAAGGKLELALTPEAKELNADFEKNKGKLPWPVEKGTITSGFGKQPHPVLRGITIENNGIDIGCEKGAPVRAMFRGEVSSVIVIPGAGKAVVVSHGAYRTVYSNLRDVNVNKGDKVDTKQTVGVVMTEDGESTAHVEIWKITSDGQLAKVDPATWIYQ
ncbi:MAG: peptidoglycan DD-metalloendopeptidase family protein [Bacteroidetes bacterium]|nr:peptidoglycan DD-metalloendopeptidase family protein [Bacteroidota bacterium]